MHTLLLFPMGQAFPYGPGVLCSFVFFLCSQPIIISKIMVKKKLDKAKITFKMTGLVLATDF